MRRDGLHAVERRLHVDEHHLVEVGVGDVEDGARESTARVVDPDIDVAEVADGGVAQALDFGSLSDVCRDDQRFFADLVGDHLERVGTTRGDCDQVPALCDFFRDRGADPAARSGDDDYFFVHGGTPYRFSVWMLVGKRSPQKLLRYLYMEDLSEGL